ncbi:MAG: double-strand break repair helicase AddA [Phreatobacter sp.]|uniref:double-strand break repair helicase AddA n=1 Tax=Phreatobacter sp. TaxID=1966341 RepID=UPI001A61B1DF|nr:double-strand break repair helicase AddA [Phreatobacter sp.]MBL8570878.1 double-strand break repair helicase AddA [Phreatobacter sp.]
MTRRFFVPPKASAAQLMASDPAVSAWVAANAGSGKTYVLARRVVRLMLAGTPPGAILCLTFTKAAAATMANRVFALLGEWALMDDVALVKVLGELDGKAPSRDRLRRARRLFAEALETPGGLKVQTIHAFCERVLHQFPFEANVASQFTVLDDRAGAELAQRARLAVLLEAAANPAGRLGRAFAFLSTLAADQTVDDLLDEAVAAREDIERLIGQEGSIERVAESLGDALGLMPGETEAALEAAIVGEALIPASEWAAVADAITQASTATRDREVAGLLSLAATEADGGQTYLEIFFTKAGEPRKAVVNKPVRDAEPALAARLTAEQERLVSLRAKLKAARLRDGTGALLTLAHAMSAEIERRKAARGALDFSDLIARTRELFDRVSARWILYKLDQGIDHILVDEAQDTSPDQWRLVERLVEEFTSGEGAREGARTLFVVGDEKQSIYSFQGADPAWFGRMRRHFASAFGKAERPFRTVDLTFSFRSTAAVLSAVDAVFEGAEARRGLTIEDAVLQGHEAARSEAPGMVELWPAVEPEDEHEPPPWPAPVDALTSADPVAKLAQRIAAHVRLWLTRRDRLPDKAQPIRAGDVLILVRRRGALFEAIIRALKNADVPVAGADRLVLGEHIAVMDLMALADCLLTPDDDLSLASVLKSPLVGMDEQELFDLASGRDGSLWQALAESGHAAAGLMARWRMEALSLTPAAFYGRVLSRDQGRRRMLARLGSEAADALDEFMSLALSFETTDIPTLHGFVAMLRAGTLEVKRDMEIGRDEVRVMTVHGAKGLEADIVILADTMGKPGGQHDPSLFRIRRPNMPEGAPAQLVWSPSMKSDVEPVALARAAARGIQADEYNRLLYVAMTRAADKLIVCGARPRKATTDVWYDLIARALGGGSAEEPADDGEGTVRRWRRGPDGIGAADEARTSAPASVALPDWIGRDAPPTPVRLRRVTPSDADTAAPRLLATPEATERRRQALLRGTLTHRLLQSLPAVPADRRAESAVRFLAGQPDLDAALGEEIARTALGLLRDPRLADLFGAGSLPEVPLAGRLAGRPVSGQIDRLLIAPERIVIADYKTNEAVPGTTADVPDIYVAQLAIYRAMLGSIHADRPAEAWLIWTADGSVMPLPAELMDAALARLGLMP